MFGTSKKNGSCTCCTWTNLVIGIFAVLIAVASLVGVYKAHVLSSGLVFGTMTGSISLITFGLSLMLVKKAMAACPCQYNVPKK